MRKEVVTILALTKYYCSHLASIRRYIKLLHGLLSTLEWFGK